MQNIVAAANEFYNSTFEFDDEITFNEKDETLECFAFFMMKRKTTYVISFNEELPTSLIVKIALVMIPWLEKALNSFVEVISCSSIVFNEEGEYIKTLMEEEYDKVIVKRT